MSTVEEQQAIANLRSHGATIRLANGHVIGLQFESLSPQLSENDLLAIRHLPSLQELDLYGTPVTNAVLCQLRILHNLRAVNLNCTGIGDAGVQHIAAWSRLTQLSLMETQVTDTLKDVLLSLRFLEDLRLDGTHISADVVQELGRHLPLVRLWMDGKQASNACLEVLASNRSLHDLNLVGPHVTDGTLQRLSTFHRLRSLSLLRTSVTADGLTVLSTLTELEQLVLNGSHLITDEAIAHLCGMRQLKMLWVPDTGMSTQGKRELRTSLPNTRIWPLQ